MAWPVGCTPCVLEHGGGFSARSGGAHSASQWASACRPSGSSGTVNLLLSARAPQVRAPMPPTYVFVIDVSFAAAACGMLGVVCAGIKASLDSLPGDERTQVAFITFDRWGRLAAAARAGCGGLAAGAGLCCMVSLPCPAVCHRRRSCPGCLGGWCVRDTECTCAFPSTRPSHTHTLSVTHSSPHPLPPPPQLHPLLQPQGGPVIAPDDGGGRGGGPVCAAAR